MQFANTHFTSDMHISHNGVMKWERTQFANLDEMHHAMIAGWNSVVGENDVVYDCGDVTFEKTNSGFGLTIEILKQLNGRVIHMKGNHDHKKLIHNLRAALLQAGVHNHTFLDTPYEEIKLEKQKIVMCHYPIADHRNCHHGNWMLHGHEHGGFTLPGKVLDVGLDAVYKKFGFFRPISGLEIKDFMDNQEIVYYGHHNEKLSVIL